ncbi:MAG: DUF2764 family protein [bacterium]
MSTYYLIASLPLLSLDQRPLITAEAFVEACRAQLGAEDAEAAEALIRNAPSQHPFVLAWRDKDAILRNAIARARARLADTDAECWLRPTKECDPGLDLLVDEAFEQPDPLKREYELNEARWRIIESLQGYDPMSVTVVLGYAIKLTLALRWINLNADQGREIFEQLTRKEF